MSFVMFPRECPSVSCPSPDCQVCLLPGPSIPDVLLFLQWTWCQDLYWASVRSQCCDPHPRLPNLQGRLYCVDLELSSRRVGLRVHLVSTHLPVEGLCSSPGGKVLSPKLTWSYPGHAERLTASARIATALYYLRRLLWSPIPEGNWL